MKISSMRVFDTSFCVNSENLFKILINDNAVSLYSIFSMCAVFSIRF